MSALLGPSAYLMKSPLRQTHDEARDCVEQFIAGQRGEVTTGR